MQLEQDPTTRLLNLLRFKARGMTITEISRATKMNRNSVSKYLQMLLVSGHVTVENVGNAKVYSLSRRIPLATVLSYSSDLMVILNAGGNIIQINDRFLRFIGRTRNDVLGASMYNGLIPVFADADLRASVERGIAGEEQSFDVEYDDVRSRRYFHVRCIPTVLEEGDRGLVITMEDITDKKGAEHSLMKSEERFRSLAENAPFPISILDASGNYVFLNKKFVETFGYTLLDIPSGRAWFSRAYPDPGIRRKALRAWKEDLLHSGVGEPRPRTFPVTCKNGSVMEILFRAITISDGTQFIVYEDVSESRRNARDEVSAGSKG